MTSTDPSRRLRVAVLGGGTVGSALLRAIAAPDSPLHDVEVVGVAVRDVDRVRPFVPHHLVTRDAVGLASRADVDVVVEALGGLDPAAAAIRAALDRGADVVTANKAVIAAVGPDLHSLAHARGSTLRYEAAAAAALPIVEVLRAAAAGDRVLAVRGVLSGTANVVLGALEGGALFDEAVRGAQAAGYAEADPSRDLDGRDTVDKLVLLARLAFGRDVTAADVQRTGIEHLTARDAAIAAGEGRRWKLVATARASGCCVVEPLALRADDPLARAEGPGNVVEVELEHGGLLTLAGAGAGGSATASAILRDLGAVRASRRGDARADPRVHVRSAG